MCGAEAKHRLFFIFLRFVYLSLLAALALFCCAGFSLDAPSVGCPLVVVCKLLIADCCGFSCHGAWALGVQVQ